MWKKIGTIASNSNDNKSSRSKDQNVYEPFSQMSKLRMNDSQILLEQNQYFCTNYLGKKKNPEGKCLSQSRIQTGNELQHAKSYKQIPSDYKPSNLKKRTLNQDQTEELKQKLSQQFIQQLNDSGEKDAHPICGQQNLRETQSTQMICSQTSLDSNIRKLKQVKSTPHFNLPQFGAIAQQIPFDKKIQTQKNLNSLKQEHKQIKATVNKQLTDFKKQFNSMQMQMKNKISQVMQLSEQRFSQKHKANHQTNKNLLNHEQIMQETKRFGQKMKNLNEKKQAMLEKYMSLRVK